MGQKFRGRSAENVFEEIRHFYGQGWKSFDFNDDCFTLKQDRAEKICDLILSSTIKIRFQLYNGIRVDTVTPSLLKKMKQAGINWLCIGFESGNKDIRQRVSKGKFSDENYDIGIYSCRFSPRIRIYGDGGELVCGG